MEGGKQLAEGGYGCVFHPEINCKGKETTNKKYISKVQQEDFSAKNETEIGKVLYDMYKSDPSKPLEVNFAPVISSCPINVRKISAPDINSCSVINKVIDRTTNFVIMKIRYIDMKDFDKYVIENADANLIIFTLLSSYNHLLKSIELLIKAKIIHLDLKGQNIVFDTKRATPVII
jgi:serine/threonine protein kinase